MAGAFLLAQRCLGSVDEHSFPYRGPVAGAFWLTLLRSPSFVLARPVLNHDGPRKRCRTSPCRAANRRQGRVSGQIARYVAGCIPPATRLGVVAEPIRVLIAKAGLDGHDRGAKVIARALRDGGVEVIYTGLHQTPEMIVHAAIQEDVQAIGLSILSGAHMTLFNAVIDLLGRRRIDDIVVFGGGIIPEEDLEALAEMGVAKVFTPGTPTDAVVEWVRANLGRTTVV